jgi:hypothetical protein
MLKAEHLEQYLNRQEGYRLEFKSTRPLFEKKERAAFMNKLSETLSAFLNSEGGDLIVGIEEGRGEERSSARCISEGVSRDVVSYEDLQRQLCDRVQPATANLINVVLTAPGLSDRLLIERLAQCSETKGWMRLGTTPLYSTPTFEGVACPFSLPRIRNVRTLSACWKLSSGISATYVFCTECSKYGASESFGGRDAPPGLPG